MKTAVRFLGFVLACAAAFGGECGPVKTTATASPKAAPAGDAGKDTAALIAAPKQPARRGSLGGHSQAGSSG